MPRLRINVRDLDELNEQIDELEAELELNDERSERENTPQRDTSTLAMQRRQEAKRWGREIARSLRRQQRERDKK